MIERPGKPPRTMSNDNGFSSSPPGLTDNTDDENKNGSSSSSEDRVLIHESETFQIWRKGDTVIKMKCPNTAKDGDDDLHSSKEYFENSL